MEKHIADGESDFYVINIAPDFCEVDGATVPFDIGQMLQPELDNYAKTVFARDEPVLMTQSVIRAVKGNAGAGVNSLVSLGAGHSYVVQGSSTVFVEDRQTARHLDLVWMNCQV